MIKLLILSLILSILISCTDFGSGENKSFASIPISQNAEDGSGKIENIIEDLDEETLVNINAIYASMDENASFESFTNIDTHYELQKFNVYNINESPITYVVNYHANGKKVYRIDIDAGTLDVFNSDSIERIRYIINFDGSEYFITQRPIKIYKADNTNNTLSLIYTFDKNLKAIPIRIGQLGKDLCLYSNQNKVFYLDLQTNASFVNSLTGNIQRIYCNTSATVFQRKDVDTVRIIRTEDQTDTILLEKVDDNKIVLFNRSSSLFYRETLLKNENRPRNVSTTYNAFDNTVTTSLPISRTNFNYLRTFVNTTDTSKSNKSFVVDIIDRKTKSLVLSLSINDAIEKENLYGKLFVANGSLYLTTRSSRNLYKLEKNEFVKLGNPHNLNIISLFMHNSQLTMATNGSYLFQVDETLPWTFGTEDYYFSRRDDSTHNPVMLERLPFGFHSVKVNENEDLNFIQHKPQKMGTKILDINSNVLAESNDSMRIYPIKKDHDYFTTSMINDNPVKAKILNTSQDEFDLHNRIRSVLKWDDNTYYYIFSNQVWKFNTADNEQEKIFTFSGKRVYVLIKSDNDKLLLINNSNLVLLDPKNLSTEVVYQLDMQSLHSIRSMKLLNGELFLVDRYFKLHKVNIPLYKLKLFDENLNV